MSNYNQVDDRPQGGQTVYIVMKDNLTRVNPCFAMIVLIVNILFPGIGTMMMGCVAPNCCGYFCTGLLQLLLAPLLIGWIWAIITGCQVVSQSRM